MFNRFKCLLAFLLLSCGSTHLVLATEVSASAVPAARLAILAKGINVSSRYQADNFRQIEDSELAEIQQMGFRHIRVPIEPLVLVRDLKPTPGSEKVLAALDDLVARATQKYNLGVVIDYHPLGEYQKLNPEGTPQDLGTSKLFWQLVTAKLNKHGADMVFYEVYNEPRTGSWLVQMPTFVAQLRQLAPDHTLLVGGAFYNSLDGLLKMKPAADKNIVYGFHYYVPLLFTHQGATWVGDHQALKTLSGMTYPVDVKRDAELYNGWMKKLLLVGDFRYAKNILEYSLGGFTKTTMQIDFAKAQAWAKQYGVPLYIGEFGVLRGNVAEQDRVNWIKDVRSTAEANNFGWAMWEFDYGFGLKQLMPSGSRIIDPLTVDALGMKMPQ